MQTWVIRFSTVVAISVLAACSSNVVSIVDPDTDFTQLQTYGYATVLDTDGSGYQSIETGYLRTAVSRELEARGFKQSAEPDVVINFSIQTQEKVTQRTVPRAAGGVGYDPIYDVYYDDWAYTHETRIDQYTEGQLKIDMINLAERKIVWSGSTKGRLTQKDLQNAQVTLNEAVGEIFTKFPVPKPE